MDYRLWTNVIMYYHLKIITPHGVEYEADVIHTRLPDERGFVGILANHAPYITSSPGGLVEIQLKDGRQEKLSVGSGFFEVMQNQATFLVNAFDAQAQKGTGA